MSLKKIPIPLTLLGCCYAILSFGYNSHTNNGNNQISIKVENNSIFDISYRFTKNSSCVTTSQHGYSWTLPRGWDTSVRTALAGGNSGVTVYRAKGGLSGDSGSLKGDPCKIAPHTYSVSFYDKAEQQVVRFNFEAKNLKGPITSSEKKGMLLFVNDQKYEVIFEPQCTSNDYCTILISNR